jgi:hypothetical protein
MRSAFALLKPRVGVNHLASNGFPQTKPNQTKQNKTNKPRKQTTHILSSLHLTGLCKSTKENSKIQKVRLFGLGKVAAGLGSFGLDLGGMGSTSTHCNPIWDLGNQGD